MTTATATNATLGKVVKLGPKTSVLRWDADKDGLDRMYKEIGCSMVEYIDLPEKVTRAILSPEDNEPGTYLTMICDEEGKLIDRPMLNAKASALFLWEYGKANFDFIAGKVLVMKVTPEGETMPLTEGEASRLKLVMTRPSIKDTIHRIIVYLCLRGQNVF